KLHRRRHDNFGLPQALLFPRLRRWMVHLEHVQFLMRIAVSERIEACAQHDILVNTLRHRYRKLILRVAASHDNKRAEGAGKTSLPLRTSFQAFGRAVIEYTQRQWIVENFGIVEQLVSRAADGDVVRGAAELTFLHVRCRCALRNGTSGSIPPRS